MGEKRNQKRESVKSVEVDVRLADIFSSHRKYGSESIAVQERDVDIPTSGSSDFDWLNQFISDIPAVSNDTDVAHTGNRNSEILKSEVRAFWKSPGDKLYISLWKKSRGVLAKDCQKQRKAAMRKASRR